MESRDLITQSETILISLPVRPTTEELQDVLTLAYVLHVLGKKVKIEGDLGKRARGLENITSQKEKTFAVSLKGLAPFISQVQYEKVRDDLKLVFTLKQGEITPANLALDIPTQKDLTVIVRNESAQDNENTVGKLLPNALALLSPEDKEAALLSGRLLFRLEYFPGIHFHSSYLRTSDFEETKTSPKTLSTAVQQIAGMLAVSNLLVFFEKNEGTQGILWSTRPRIQQKMVEVWDGEIKDKWGLFSVPTKNIDSMQENIQFLL